MKDALLVILSIIGLFGLYWALIGQWKYNKMIREAEYTMEQVENKLDSLEHKDKQKEKTDGNVLPPHSIKK